MAATRELFAPTQSVHCITTYDTGASQTIKLLLVLDGFKTFVHVMRQATVGVECSEPPTELLEGNIDLAENVDGHAILEKQVNEQKSVQVSK